MIKFITAASLIVALFEFPVQAATFGYVGGQRYHIECSNGCHFPCDPTSGACVRNMLRSGLVRKVGK